MRKSITLLFIFHILYSVAQLGTIDPTFLTGSGLNSGGNYITLLSNGKYLIGGYFTDYNSNTVSRLIRLNTDGSTNNDLTGAPKQWILLCNN